MRQFFVGLFIAALTSCVSSAIETPFDYDELGTGTLSGEVVVKWLEPDLFLFEPSVDNPFSYTTSDGEKIQPGQMITDGGSIPRPLWILRNYSPWGFTPAFMIHDWQFVTKQCELEGYEDLTLEEAGFVMAEIMKTMIESEQIEAGRFTVFSMFTAVTSRAASDSWENGECVLPPTGLGSIAPVWEFTLSFD